MYVKENFYLIMIQVKVYKYNRRHGVREYAFLVNSRYESYVKRRGRKRVNIIQLFKRIRTKLVKVDPREVYEQPDQKYSFEIPGFKLRKC